MILETHDTNDGEGETELLVVPKDSDLHRYFAWMKWKLVNGDDADSRIGIPSNTFMSTILLQSLLDDSLSSRSAWRSADVLTVSLKATSFTRLAYSIMERCDKVENYESFTRLPPPQARSNRRQTHCTRG